MKTVKEIQAEVKREESVLNQLEKRGAASSVIEAQKEAVKAAKKKLEAALNTPTEKAIQSTATTGFVTFNVVKDGETIKESKKIAFVNTTDLLTQSELTNTFISSLKTNTKKHILSLWQKQKKSLKKNTQLLISMEKQSIKQQLQIIM
ncbi:MAG: hypothetical protein ACLR6J_20120 [Parabacteroides merdae]